MKLYKQKYLIVFYDKTDEQLLHIFDNIRQILKFMKREINEYNSRQINIMLYNALKSEHKFCRFLTGEVMRVYLVEY